MKKPWYQRLITWIKIYFNTILYIGILIILTKYILHNWEKCISMQFFSQFDGNNILFLVWIASILLFFMISKLKAGSFIRKGLKIQRSNSKMQNLHLLKHR